MQWVKTTKRLPGAVYEIPGGLPTISADVAVYFDDVGVDIANYDHEEKHWSLPNRRFDQPDIEPTHWCELPELPTRESGNES